MLKNKLTKKIANFPFWLTYSIVGLVFLEGIYYFIDRKLVNDLINKFSETLLFQNYTTLSILIILALVAVVVLFFKTTKTGRYLLKIVISMVIIFMAINTHRYLKYVHQNKGTFSEVKKEIIAPIKNRPIPKQDTINYKNTKIVNIPNQNKIIGLFKQDTIVKNTHRKGNYDIDLFYVTTANDWKIYNDLPNMTAKQRHLTIQARFIKLK